MGAHHTPLAGDFDERSVFASFRRDGLSPVRWSNGPGDVYASHSHAYHKVLFCLRGSITFRLEQAGEEIELHAGDRLDIEPGTARRRRERGSGVRRGGARTEDVSGMCRSIKTLRRGDEPATAEEIRAAALQFVRKVSGFRQPSRRNAEAFDAAVDEISDASRRLLDALAQPGGDA